MSTIDPSSPSTTAAGDPAPETVDFDHDESSHWKCIPGFVHAIAEAFDGYLDVDLDTWYEHLVLHPAAREKRAQWIRLAGLMKIFTTPPHGIDPFVLAGFLRALPTSPENCAWQLVRGFDLGLLPFQDLASLYYRPGPRTHAFVQGLHTHGVPTRHTVL